MKMIRQRNISGEQCEFEISHENESLETLCRRTLCGRIAVAWAIVLDREHTIDEINKEESIYSNAIRLQGLGNR